MTPLKPEVTEMLTVGSLFSGIGGLELGLEMTGAFRTVWQVEQSEYCRKVLARHWPDATRFKDVRNVGKENLSPVDVICGGFPCQDISYAGRGGGLEGERSGLWYEYARIIRELEPRYVIVENVAALFTRGLDAVLGTLADCGYDAEWSRLSAADVGAPHLRERVFVVAYTNGLQHKGRASENWRAQTPLLLADANSPRLEGRHREVVSQCAGQRLVGSSDSPVADTGSDGCHRCSEQDQLSVAGSEQPASRWDDAGRCIGGSGGYDPRDRTRWQEQGGQWLVEPNVGRVAARVPHRVDRLRALGNAVVPQCARVIGEWLLEIDAELSQEGVA